MLQNNCEYRQIIFFTCLFILSAVMLNPCIPVAAEDDKDKQQELESVNKQIQDVKSDLDEARTESEKLQEELKQTEIAAGREALRIKGLEEQISKKNSRLGELGTVINKQEKALDLERTELARQIRAAYMAGRSDYLKLLLNQEDPARVGRVLAYYDYYNRARTRSIHSIQEKLDLIAELRGNIESETAALEQLKQRQLARQSELEQHRESRSEILQKLVIDIDRKGDQLKSLQEQKQKLTALLEELDKQGRLQDTPGFYQDLTPFETLKGKLDWPVNGTLLNRYGSRRKGESLKWQGVRISGRPGDEVQAVHGGKVIFADWFRNLGLLVILDHGNGYMSLYGYNQSLLKKPGDWVLAGETIAYVGDSGGQSVPGVYFEIRHNGKPVNPALWCSR